MSNKEYRYLEVGEIVTEGDERLVFTSTLNYWEVISTGPWGDRVPGFALFTVRRPIVKEPTKTLRDEFAMAALTGLLVCNALNMLAGYAEESYRVADEMMKARAK